MAIDLNDKTANANNLTNNGAAEVTTALPFAQSTIAVDLESTESDNLSAADSASLSITDKFTIELWVKFESTPASGNTIYMVSKRDDGSTPARGGYGFGMRNDVGTLQILGVANQTADTTTRDVFKWNWTPTLGTWYHLALSCDPAQASATTFVFYVDGVSQGNGDSLVSGNIASINDNVVTLTIGCEIVNSVASNFTDGIMDEVRIWNVVRTGTQIADNRSIELVGDETGLVAYWPFESLLPEGVPFDLTSKYW